ncbi:2-oxo-4-hydroxy-4-carboxy-5-ureidoimidazoline decarboxylase [Leucothrix pacifica]|uniref:2-oxo-4-hydroxy-4-carboxy-5-ureidoimidazoline decarboxylase n=2 Tax=Leucothrix pacifica TaxID=1247513 RepID=A0A317CHP8_9GAMM|nr:2-oxo-4-hydroxy-4-carboxy-5-ureidoimidazoline decarboxylase [Leucothrix pacifica]
MSKARFIEVFGGVYEHSAWLAEAVYEQGLTASDDHVDALSQRFQAVLDVATKAQKLALINAHPDLAGKAAAEGRLTKESTSEQSGAGIDQCTEEEYARFQTLNAAYKDKFQFPFIKAVKGSNRHIILAAFETRIHHDWETEYQQAITEIHKIARFRLEDIASTQAQND